MGAVRDRESVVLKFLYKGTDQSFSKPLTRGWQNTYWTPSLCLLTLSSERLGVSGSNMFGSW